MNTTPIRAGCRPDGHHTKTAVVLLCAALCLAAWVWKGELMMGLALAVFAIGGITREWWLRRRSAMREEGMSPADVPHPTGAKAAGNWLARDRRLTRSQQVLCWCVALPLIVWWPTRFQLMKAVADNRPHQVALCLMLGCNVNAELRVIPHAWYLGSPGIRTPLYEAIRTSNAAMVRYLIRHGADPNQYCGEPNQVGSPINQTEEAEVRQALDEGIDATGGRRQGKLK